MIGNVEGRGNLTLTANDSEIKFRSKLTGVRVISGVEEDMFRLSQDDNDVAINMFKYNTTSGTTEEQISLSSSSGNITCKTLDVDGNSELDGNVDITGNTEITGNLTISGSLVYDGDLSFNDLVFDGFLSQRVDGGNATTELVRSEILNAGINDGGGKIIVKNMQGGGINSITEAIIIDGINEIITTPNLTTTNLTATNFTFDNDLTTRKLIADEIEVVDKDNSNEKAITLDGTTGNIDISFADNSGGQLSCKTITSSGNINSTTGITAGGQLSGNTLNITTTANIGTTLTCQTLNATNISFDNDLRVRELISDRIELVNENNADAVTIVLDGGINPDFPDFPAGSMVVGGSINQLTPSSATDQTPNVFNGGLKIGPEPQNTNTEIFLNGNLKINGTNRKIRFNTITQSLEGYSSLNPTEVYNLDLRSSTNKFPQDDGDAYQYIKVWDSVSALSWGFNGGMSGFKNMLGYDVSGARHTNMDFTFQVGGGSFATADVLIEMYFFGVFNFGAFIIGLMELNNGEEAGMIAKSTRVFSNVADLDKHHIFKFIIPNLQVDTDITVAPYILGTDSSAVTEIMRFENGANVGSSLNPTSLARGPWMLSCETLNNLNYTRNESDFTT